MNIANCTQLYPNLFLVNDNEMGVLYAPLLGKFCTVNMEGVDIIQQFIREGRNKEHEFYSFLEENKFLEEGELPRVANPGPYLPKDLTLSITTNCNLRCTYCYAEGGAVHLNLPWESIKISIEQMYTYGKMRKKKEVELSFHGTGEATLHKEVFFQTVRYALDLLPKNWKINFYLVTNGTLLDEQLVEFLALHNFTVVLSMDGPKEIQNTQRPQANGEGSYELAIQGAQLLVKYGVNFAIRSTITGFNQDYMYKFLELCASIGCSSISVSPFSLAGRGKSGIKDIDPERFVEHYISTKKRAKELGVTFSMPSDYLDNVSARYCDADGESMAVMPEGLISCCTRVTRSYDDLSDKFFVGRVTPEGIGIDQEKVEALKGLNLYNFAECQECFAKFTCAGGCHHTRLLEGGKQPESYCKIMKGVLWNTLREASLEANL